jgi:hypothetical protein
MGPALRQVKSNRWKALSLWPRSRKAARLQKSRVRSSGIFRRQPDNSAARAWHSSQSLTQVNAIAWLQPRICDQCTRCNRKTCVYIESVIKGKDRMQKYSYSKDRRVLVAGFGSALLLISLFLLLMSWLSEQVHLSEFCLSRFSR